MKFESLVARILPLIALVAALAAFAAVLTVAALPAKASVGPQNGTLTAKASATPSTKGPADARPELSLAASIEGATLTGPPRCTLHVSQESYEDGDTVRASLHLSNPTPNSAEVEMKLWFSAPGEPPLSLADPVEGGRPLELPGMLNRDSGKLRLFSVDPETPRGIYEMNCRLIDPITGSLVSEDINSFRVK